MASTIPKPDLHDRTPADQTDTQSMPPAGPHAKERLIDREKTPGTGSLPDERQPDADVGPD